MQEKISKKDAFFYRVLLIGIKFFFSQISHKEVLYNSGCLCRVNIGKLLTSIKNNKDKNIGKRKRKLSQYFCACSIYDTHALQRYLKAMDHNM